MTTLTPEDRARLRDLAGRATPGPWTVEHGSDWDSDEGQVAQSSVRRADRVAITWDDHGGEVFVPADAEFITAADPATVTALLDTWEAAEARADRAEAAAHTLGGIVEWQCRDIARIADAEHLVQDDGDADWGMIWALAEERATRGAAAKAAVQRVRDLHRPDTAGDCTGCRPRGMGFTVTHPCATIRALDGDA